MAWIVVVTDLVAIPPYLSSIAQLHLVQLLSVVQIFKGGNLIDFASGKCSLLTLPDVDGRAGHQIKTCILRPIHSSVLMVRITIASYQPTETFWREKSRVTNNFSGTIGINQDCPEKTKMYTHPT